MRILLVEDSERMRRSVSAVLKKAGFAVDVSADGEDGLWMAEAGQYDVILLDIMLPKLDGWTVLRRLREKGADSHILLLTARDEVDDRVRGLEQGADDYLTKPFAFEELLARVKALCRRAYRRKSPKLTVGGLEIDFSRREVFRGGAAVELLPREYQILEYLALRRGELVTRSEIEAHIYDDMADPMSNVVNSAICLLRKKISPPGSPPLIHTRRGQGYLFDLPETS